MPTKKSVIIFNHISKQLSDKESNELKKLYKYYHKLATCYRWKYKKLKKIKLALNMVSTGLVVTGTIAGTVTLNPIILGVVTGSGVILQGYLTKSNISNKVEHCKFAYTNYQKIMVQLKTYLRGISFNEEIFLSDAKVIEDIVIDMCPSINGMSNKYNKIYGESLLTLKSLDNLNKRNSI